MADKLDFGAIKVAEPTGSYGASQSQSLHGIEVEDLDNEQNRQVIADLIQDRTERKKYGGRLYWLVVVWLSVMGLMIVANGFKCIPFELSPVVLSSLIGTTTVSVLGMFTLVAKYLFPARR